MQASFNWEYWASGFMQGSVNSEYWATGLMRLNSILFQWFSHSSGKVVLSVYFLLILLTSLEGVTFNPNFNKRASYLKWISYLLHLSMKIIKTEKCIQNILLIIPGNKSLAQLAWHLVNFEWYVKLPRGVSWICSHSLTFSPNITY